VLCATQYPKTVGVIRRRLLGFVAACAVVAASLSACVPDTSDSGAWGQELAREGIATVPFGGGDALYPVDDAVLVLTDWQVASLYASLPQGDTNNFRGVPASELDDTFVALPDTTNLPPELLPSALVLSWWRDGTSSRAALARSQVAPPTTDDGAGIPLTVLALFTADAFADFGRSGADLPSARSEGTTLAAGEIVLADSGPCGTVNDAIDSAHKFLADAGIIGSVIKAAAGAAIDAVSTAVGVAAIKKVIAVVNVVMNTASLITPWKVTTELSNGGSYVVGTNGTTGVGGTFTVKLEGAVNQPGAAESACLQLIGVQDPTDQKGSTVQWAGYDGYVSGVTPSLLVRGSEPPTLDENNSAVLEFSTGNQDIDTSKAELTVDANVHVSVRVERADIAKLTAYIRSLDTAATRLVLGTLLEDIATDLQYLVNPNTEYTQVLVNFWKPKDQPEPDPGGGTDSGTGEGAPGNEAQLGIGWCLDPEVITSISGQGVSEHYTEKPADNPVPEGVDNPYEVQDTCLYKLDNGLLVAIVAPYFVYDPDGGFDYAMTGDNPGGSCNRAAGPVFFGEPMLNSYYVWSGNSLAGTFVYFAGDNSSYDWLPTLAFAAGLCG
jgi:hypothetical protein